MLNACIVNIAKKESRTPTFICVFMRTYAICNVNHVSMDIPGQNMKIPLHCSEKHNLLDTEHAFEDYSDQNWRKKNIIVLFMIRLCALRSDFQPFFSFLLWGNMKSFDRKQRNVHENQHSAIERLRTKQQNNNNIAFEILKREHQ